MDDISFVQVVDGVKDLANSLRRILLGELAVLADPIKQLTTRSELRDDVEFVLSHIRPARNQDSDAQLTFDSNQSTKWTMLGWLRACNISSSS